MIDADVFNDLHVSPFALPDSEVVDGESNTSIIAKIAWRYRARPAAVARYVLQNEKVSLSALGRDLAASVNSLTDKSQFVDRRLGFVTGIKGFGGSYAHLRGFLDHGARGLISPYKKWCSQCYQESLQQSHRANSARVSDQVYWSLDVVTHCIKHLCSLSSCCGRCYQRQPYISFVVEPGFCHYCYAKLSDAPSVIAESELEQKAVQAIILKYDVLYPLRLSGSASWTMSKLAKNLRAVIELCGENGLSEVAFRCGVSEYTLKDWCVPRHGVKFESLIHLVDGLGLSRASDLFVEPGTFCALVGGQFCGSFNFRARKSRQSVIPQLTAYFRAVVTGDEKPMARSVIAEQFGVSVGMLENAFKAELDLVSREYAKQKKAESLKVKDRLQYDMNKAVQRCGSKGRSFDWPHILSELKGIDWKYANQKDLDRARTKAVRKYLNSEKRDPDRDVRRLVDR